METLGDLAKKYVLIYSRTPRRAGERHRAKDGPAHWWAPDGMGYVQTPAEAGLFSPADAQRRIGTSRDHVVVPLTAVRRPAKRGPKDPAL